MKFNAIYDRHNYRFSRPSLSSCYTWIHPAFISYGSYGYGVQNILV